MSIPLLAMGAATGTSALMNWFGANSATRRRKDLQRQLMELLSPERLGKEAGGLFDIIRSSPMYTGMRRNAMIGASSLGNQLQTSFAQRGLSRSGIAGLAEPIARSSFQGQFANIDATMFAKALSEARQNLTDRANILKGTSGPGTGEQWAGSTLESLMPLLLAYFSQGKGK